MGYPVSPKPLRLFLCVLALGACNGGSAFRSGSGELLTQRADNGRTGASLNEKLLRPSSLGALSLVRSFPVDEQVYAQPLVVEGVDGPTGRHTLLLVATMANTFLAYDFDAPGPGEPLWQVGAAQLGIPGSSPRNVGGKNGILATPAVDRARSLVYVVSRDCDPAAPDSMPVCRFHLSALRLADGATQSTRIIDGAVTNAAGEVVEFDASLHWNRPALLLAADRLYVGFGSGPPENDHEEDFVYHGWLFSFSTSDFGAAPTVFCTTPGGRGGSLWQGGGGIAADEAHLYFTGANGILGNTTFPPSSWPTTPRGAEDSIGRMPLDAASQMDGHYWDDRPYHADGNVFQYMESGDNGFGSAAPTLIPGSRDLITTGKSGMVYLIDRDRMTAVQAPLAPFNNLPLQAGHDLYLHSWWGIPFCSTLTFYRQQGGASGLAFGWAAGDFLKSFRYDYAARTLTVASTAATPASGTGSSGGAVLALSADGDDDSSAIVWALSRRETEGSDGRLWAFDPLTLAELWHADTPAFQKFAPPAVVRGHVLVPATGTGSAQKAILDFARTD
jgi:hypothetical protein